MSTITEEKTAEAKPEAISEGVATPPKSAPDSARREDSVYFDFMGIPSKRTFTVPIAVRYLLIFLAAFAIGFWISRKHDRAPVVVATINGDVIDKEVFFHRLQIANGPAVIRQIATEDLQIQFAKTQGVAPTKAQIDDRYNEASNRPGFQDYLTSHGMSVNDYKRSLAVQLAQINVATKGIDVTDSEVKSYYQENVDKNNAQAQFYMPETIQVDVIVTPTRERADQAYQQLVQYVPFDVVARKYSTDSASASGGVLPPLQRGRTKFNNMPGLEDMIFGLKIGDLAGPAKFGSHWWIIRCVDKAPEITLPFSEVKGDCIIGAKMKKAMPLKGRSVQEEFDQFQRDSRVKVFWPQYQGALGQ